LCSTKEPRLGSNNLSEDVSKIKGTNSDLFRSKHDEDTWSKIQRKKFWGVGYVGGMDLLLGKKIFVELNQTTK
jgi:hypothetical protein